MNISADTLIILGVLGAVMFSCMLTGLIIGAIAISYVATNRLRELNSVQEGRNVGHSGLLSDNREILNSLRRLQKLKEQAATYGIETPPQVLTEIDSLEEKVSRWLD